MACPEGKLCLNVPLALRLTQGVLTMQEMQRDQYYDAMTLVCWSKRIIQQHACNCNACGLDVMVSQHPGCHLQFMITQYLAILMQLNTGLYCLQRTAWREQQQ